MHEIVIVVAKYFILLSAILAFATWWQLSKSQKQNFIILAVLSGILTLVLAKIGSKLYYDPRPFVNGHFKPYFSHANDNGFPSDHMLLASFLAFLTLRYNRTLGWTALIVALLIGAARIIAGVHYVSDIAGSFVFAAVAVVLITWLQPKFSILYKDVDAPRSRQPADKHMRAGR